MRPQLFTNSPCQDSRAGLSHLLPRGNFRQMPRLAKSVRRTLVLWLELQPQKLGKSKRDISCAMEIYLVVLTSISRSNERHHAPAQKSETSNGLLSAQQLTAYSNMHARTRHLCPADVLYLKPRYDPRKLKYSLSRLEIRLIAFERLHAARHVAYEVEDSAQRWPSAISRQCKDSKVVGLENL